MSPAERLEALRVEAGLSREEMARITLLAFALRLQAARARRAA